jgi:hypothetical protein
VIDKQATTEVAFAQEVSESDSRSCRDVSAELSPAILAVYQRLLEFLLHTGQSHVNLSDESSIDLPLLCLSVYSTSFERG